MDADGGLAAIPALLTARSTPGDGSIVITGANADPGATVIRERLQHFAGARPGGACSVAGRQTLSEYLMRHVDAVVGNSSSGLLEAPAVGVPTVDIGPRQQGRLRAPSVLHCGESAAGDPTGAGHGTRPGAPCGSRRRVVSRRTDNPGTARRIIGQLSTLESLPER